MQILIDINHPAHVNFFKTAVYQLAKKGHHILITVLNRGKLPVIAKDVFKEFEIKIINRHRGNKMSILFEANIFKFFTLFWICLKFRPDIGLSAGSFVLGAVLKILGKPNIQFDDDPERKMNVLLEKITSTFLFFPVFYNETSKKTGKYNALKEWSYLSPHYINPAPEIVSDYGIKIKEYIFVREVSVGTLNYTDQPGNIIASVAKLFPKEMKVLLSLENKSAASKYPDHWIILKEPVTDIHSLIYFSKIVISSGDSMAREGAMLGVPSIYCGIREMAANKVMTDKKMLLHLKIQDVPDTISEIISVEKSFPEQDTFRSGLMNEWDDVPGFILEKINSLI